MPFSSPSTLTPFLFARGVRYFFPFSILFSILLLASCGSVRPGAVKSARNLYETFYVGEDGTQYFIKPLKFERPGDVQSELLLDLTFRFRNEVRDTATLNFTIEDDRLYRSVERFEIAHPGFAAKSADIELLYNQRAGDGFASRFSARLPMADLVKVFDSADWTLTVQSGEGEMRYLPVGKTERAVVRLQDGVFVVFEN